MIITSTVTKEQVEGRLISNFKVIRQGHVNYFSIFGFYDLNLVKNDTNLITLSHLHHITSISPRTPPGRPRANSSGQAIYRSGVFVHQAIKLVPASYRAGGETL